MTENKGLHDHRKYEIEMMKFESPIPKPNAKRLLGRKAYGSIPHLPGSRVGPAEHTITQGQADILTVKPRDKHDKIIITEKLDGSNCAIAKIDGDIVPLTRAGYYARTSKYKQHHLFADWVERDKTRWDWIEPGDWVCGEWLIMAHGTRYMLPHEPYVIFDYMVSGERMGWYDLEDLSITHGFIMPQQINSHLNRPLDPEYAYRLIRPITGTSYPEGVVYRCERNGRVDFLAKWVHPDKEDGKYFDEDAPVWNGFKGAWISA